MKFLFPKIGIIGTVHLDVRITVWVRSFLRTLCGVWTTTTTTVVVRTLLWCGNMDCFFNYGPSWWQIQSLAIQEFNI